MKSHREAEIAVEVKFWKDGWTPSGIIAIPPGYARLPKGSTFATRTAKRLAKEAGRTVFVEMKHSKRGGYSSPVACWVPRAIIGEARRIEEETEARRVAARERAVLSRTRRHERDVDRLAARLGDLYPGLPEADRPDIIRHAFEVGSRRVGRATKLEEDHKLELALFAHARHSHTTYDEMLAGGWDREDARDRIRDKVRSIVRHWKEGTPPTH